MNCYLIGKQYFTSSFGPEYILADAFEMKEDPSKFRDYPTFSNHQLDIVIRLPPMTQHAQTDAKVFPR